MLSHDQVWAAIDRLAQRHGFTPSGLAKRAGLDPTTFNPSKRFASDGRPRWPSTESIAKILEATGESLATFVTDVGKHEPLPFASSPYRLPLSPLEGSDDLFQVSTECNSQTDEASIAFPDPRMKNLVALEITSRAFLPYYRKGDIVVVAPQAPARKGDRIVLKLKGHDPDVRLLNRRTDDGLEVRSLDANNHPEQIERCDIEWSGRIIWASQ